MALCLLISLLILSRFGIADSPVIPELIIPGEVDTAPAFDVIRRFGSATFRHDGIAFADFSPPEPFFSPSGDTVYVPGNHALTALDTATGQVRFHYRYSGYNLRIRNDGKAGVRVDFDQGPVSGKYVLLEHSTGKELMREAWPRPKGFTITTMFANNRRAVAWQSNSDGDRPGPQISSRTGVLVDMTNSSVIAELGDRKHSAVLSPDHHHLAVRTPEAEVRVFDTESGKLLRSLPMPEQETYDALSEPAWSSDSNSVYFWRKENKLVQFVSLAVESGDVRVLLKDAGYVFNSPTVSADGKYLAYKRVDNAGEERPYWRIISLKDLAEVAEVDIRPASTQGAFSPDSKSLWLLSNCGLARFDLATGKLDPLSADPLVPTECLSFSANGTRLHAVAGVEVITWDVETGQEIGARTTIDDSFRTTRYQRCLHISNDGRRTIWAGKSHVHALIDGKIVSKFYSANVYQHHGFDFTPDHQQIVHDAYYGELKQGNLWTGETTRELLPKVSPREQFDFAIAPDNRTMALVHRDHTNNADNEEFEIELWDLQQGRKTGGVQQVVGRQMKLQFSQDSRELRVYEHKQQAVWDVATGELVRRQTHPESFSHYFYSLNRASPNRHWMFYAGHRSNGGKMLVLVDVHTSQIAREWDYPAGSITAHAFSPDMTLLALASTGTQVTLRRFHEPRPGSEPLREQSDAELVHLLRGSDATSAFDAMCELIDRGDECLPTLQTALTNNTDSSVDVRRWIRQLDSAVFTERDEATRNLLKATGPITPLLKQAVKKGSTEQKSRLKEILESREVNGVPADDLAVYRGVEVLTAIPSSKALALLKRLAEGDENETATHEARATLIRVSQ